MRSIDGTTCLTYCFGYLQLMNGDGCGDGGFQCRISYDDRRCFMTAYLTSCSCGFEDGLGGMQEPSQNDCDDLKSACLGSLSANC